MAEIAAKRLVDHLERAGREREAAKGQGEGPLAQPYFIML